MKLRFSALLLIVLSMYAKAFPQPINVQDSLALVDLYNSTNGPGWNNSTNWLTTEPVSTWYGVHVTGTRVTSLYLDGNHLNGTLPSSIGNLVKLTECRLGTNQLSGAIPSSIGNLVNLTYLDLGSNQLSGAIPSSIGNLTNLQVIDLGQNTLSNVIPTTHNKINAITRLDVGAI